MTPKELAVAQRQRQRAGQGRTAWASPVRPTSPTAPLAGRAHGPAARPAGLPRRDRPVEGAPSVRDYDEAARRAVRELLVAIGEDPDRDGLRDTPARVARAYARAVRRPAADAGGRADHHLRPRPRRDGAGQGHRGVVDAASTTWCRSRASPTSATSRRGRPDHRAVQARPAGRRLRPAPAGAGAAHHADRRLADAHPRAARRDRGDRVRAPVHDDARRAQARLRRRSPGRPRPAARPGDPGRGDEPHR